MSGKLLRMELREHGDGRRGMVALDFERTPRVEVREWRGDRSRRTMLDVTEDQLEEIRQAIVTHQKQVKEGRA